MIDLPNKGTWENDIRELGCKYQMTDLSACLGLSALKHLTNLIQIQILLNIYKEEISHKDIKVINVEENEDYFTCPWLCTLIVERDRFSLMEKLRKNVVESAQVHYRNDRYSIFGGRKNDLPNMDLLEEKYLVLPIHHKMSRSDCSRICEIINSNG